MSKQFVCNEPECGYTTNEKSNLTRHIKSKHTAEKTFLYNCSENDCHYKTDDKSKFTRHITSKHGNKREFVCNLCSKAFKSRDNLNEHFQTHSNTKLKCELCPDKEFSSKPSLRNHVREYHESVGEHKCSECDKVFNTSKNLDTHMLTHGDKKFKCKLCDKSYANPQNLHRHVKEFHKPDKTCTYENCQEKFLDMSSLKEHLDNIHKLDEKLIHCSECEFMTDSIERITQHMSDKHTKKTYSCPHNDCNFVGPHPSRLEDHMVVHTTERPFLCQTCGKSFKSYDVLKQHLLVHTNKRPYKCKMCNSVFKSQSQLTGHTYWHDDSRRFECDLCTKSYKCSAHLRRHLDERHGDEMSIARKRKENQVYDFLKSKFSVLTQHRVDFKCINYDENYCYIDFLLIHNSIVFFIEVDEYQHKHYEVVCEVKRMLNVLQSLHVDGNTLPIVFIRYNPDSYYVDGGKQLVTDNTRLEQLCDFIESFKPERRQSIKYMYYNETDGQTDIVLHPDYIDDVKQFVI